MTKLPLSVFFVIVDLIYVIQLFLCHVVFTFLLDTVLVIWGFILCLSFLASFCVVIPTLSLPITSTPHVHSFQLFPLVITPLLSVVILFVPCVILFV